MKRRLSFRFLACLVGVTAFFAVGGHFLHGFQVRRNAGDLKAKAEQAADAKKYPEAIKEYSRYLQLVPDDGDACADYGLVLDQMAKSLRDRQTAFFVLDHGLLLKPDRADARRRLVGVAMDIQRFSDAQDHLKKLMEASPKNAELELLRGRCQEAANKLTGEDGAVSWNTQSIAHDRGSLDSYARLADLYRSRLNKPADAEATMAKMVQANTSHPAYVRRAYYYRTGGSEPARNNQADSATSSVVAEVVAYVAGSAARLAYMGSAPDLLFKAELDLEKARATGSDDAEVLLESARVALALHRFDRADEYARHGLELYPKDVRMYKQVADVAVQSGHGDKAIELLKKGVAELPEEVDLTFLLADLLIADGKLDEATPLLAQLKAKGVDPGILDFMEGRKLFGQKKWLVAAKKLEGAYTSLARRPELARQTALLLGTCYEQLGDPDQQYSAYRRAYTEDPSDPAWFPAAEGVARSLLAMNKVNEALDAYRKLVPHAPGARVVVVRLLLLHNLGLPQGERDWKEVDRLLKEAASIVPKPPELPSLRVQVLVAKASYQEPKTAAGSFEVAKSILQEARADDPRDASLWIVQAALDGACPPGTAVVALKVLDEAEKELGDLVEFRLARVRFLLQLEGKDAAKSLGKVEEGAAKFSAPEKLRLWRGLAEAYTTINELPKARQLWERVAAENKDDLGVWLKLFDLTLLANDDAGMDGAVREIQKFEGEKGTLWRYATAARLINSAEHGDRKALDQARALLTPVAARRPTWARVPVCQARIEVLLGNTDGALRYYLSAVELGERGSFILMETIRLLRQRQRYAEAYQVIQKLPEQTPLLQQMSDVVIDLSLRSKDFSRALDLALKAVRDNPNDYHTHLSLGEVYGALGDQVKAEDAIRTALKMPNADKVPDTWATLVLFLARSPGRKEEALKTIQQAQEKLPVGKNRLAYAQCYEAVGDLNRAKELYDEALKAGPVDAALLRAVAGFALRTGKPKEAEALLKQLVGMKKQAPEEAAAAWRMLGLVLAGDASDYEQKYKLLAELGYLDRPLDNSFEAPDDKRTRAIILAAQGRRRNREEAIRVLEEIGKAQPLTNDDQFLLAQLYNSLGNTGKAHELLRSVLSKTDDNPQFLAYFVRVLLVRGEAGEAGTWLARLEKLQPKAWQTVELEARVLQATGEKARALAVLVKHADEEKDAPLYRIARQLEEMGEKPAAKKMFGRLVEKSHEPVANLLFAEFLGRTGESAAALELCDQIRAKSPPESVMPVALEVLYGMNASKADLNRVEGWIKEALQAAKDNVKLRAALRQSLANLYNLENRFEDAEATFRLCLEENPRDALSMNNLAWFLAVKGKNLDEALAVIKKAIALFGPKPDLLDTLAIVYLSQGKNDLAIGELEEVVADTPTAAGFFHLAQAHHAGGNKKAAREDIRKAKHLGLDEKDLHPFEREPYRKLVADLGAG